MQEREFTRPKWAGRQPVRLELTEREKRPGLSERGKFPAGGPIKMSRPERLPIAENQKQFVSTIYRALGAGESHKPEIQRRDSEKFEAEALKQIRELVERGLDPNFRLPNKALLLQCVASHGWPKLTGYLLSKGADPNQKGIHGKTPIESAVTPPIDRLHHRHVDVVRVLKEHGAEVMPRENRMLPPDARKEDAIGMATNRMLDLAITDAHVNSMSRLKKPTSRQEEIAGIHAKIWLALAKPSLWGNRIRMKKTPENIPGPVSLRRG